MVNLIARHVNKFSITSFKNWGPLLEIISNGVPNRIKTHSYENRVTSYFIKAFKACTSTNFVKQFMATAMNQCLLLIIGNGFIKTIPHFSKGPKGGMGCEGPF
jgi:hypothetical protein